MHTSTLNNTERTIENLRKEILGVTPGTSLQSRIHQLEELLNDLLDEVEPENQAEFSVTGIDFEIDGPTIMLDFKIGTFKIVNQIRLNEVSNASDMKRFVRHWREVDENMTCTMSSFLFYMWFGLLAFTIVLWIVLTIRAMWVYSS